MVSVELTQVICYLRLATVGSNLSFFIQTPHFSVFSVLLLLTPWLTLALAAVWKNLSRRWGVVSLGLASQLARPATKTVVRPRAAPSVKNSLSPNNVTAWWSEPCAPRLSLSVQRVGPEHHSRAYSRLADFVS